MYFALILYLPTINSFAYYADNLAIWGFLKPLETPLSFLKPLKTSLSLCGQTLIDLQGSGGEDLEQCYLTFSSQNVLD